MKPCHAILTAAAFAFTSCDGEKAKEAQEKTVEAGKAIGEASKEVAGKVVEKTKEGAKTAGEKIKSVAETIGAKSGPAVEKFKQKMTGVSDWFKKSKNHASDDPAKAQRAVGDVMNQLKGISPDEVPADLKEPFQKYLNAMNRLQAMTANLPAQKEAAEKWYLQNADKLGALEKDFLEAARSFKAAAAKHGMGELELGTESE